MAVYVGVYGLLLGVANTVQQKNVAAFAVLLVAVAVNICAVILGAVRGHQAHPRPKVRGAQVLWRSLVVTVLLLVYESSQPGNPLEVFFGLSTAVGVAIAVVLNIIIGMVAGTVKD